MAHIAALAFKTCGATSGAAQLADSSRLPLRLSQVVVTGGFMVDAALLSALSTVAVDRLDVELHSHDYQWTAPALAAHCRALGKVTSLKQLELISTLPQPPDIIAALQPLTRLTKLGTTLDPALAVWLPASLRSLDVTISPIPGRDEFQSLHGYLADRYGYQADNPAAAGADSPVDFSLSHLTALTSLVLRSGEKGRRSAITTKLPQHLDMLVVFGAFEVQGLQCLQKAHVYATAEVDLCILQQLADLEEPWGLVLDMDFAPVRPAPPHNWLRDRDDWPSPRHVDPEEVWSALQVAASALGACTQLTSLFVREEFRGRELLSVDDSPWCAAIQDLPCLQEICIAGVTPPTHDLLHLAALPSLYHLTLCEPGLEDGPSTFAFLARLTALHNLNINCGTLRTTGILRGISSLVQLTSLELYGWEQDVWMFDDEVQLFAALQSLRVLRLPLLNQCSQAAINALTSYLPNLRVLQLS